MLLAVDPVVQGRTRAEQFYSEDKEVSLFVNSKSSVPPNGGTMALPHSLVLLSQPLILKFMLKTLIEYC